MIPREMNLRVFRRAPLPQVFFQPRLPYLADLPFDGLEALPPTPQRTAPLTARCLPR